MSEVYAETLSWTNKDIIHGTSTVAYLKSLDLQFYKYYSGTHFIRLDSAINMTVLALVTLSYFTQWTDKLMDTWANKLMDRQTNGAADGQRSIFI